ncbi:hypothetical protein HDU97_006589 [Phlyctochytrium planicorne]|nr:hypothetical protein HDU97_006589 [Phlyctochytrium planicorne]
MEERMTPSSSSPSPIDSTHSTYLLRTHPSTYPSWNLINHLLLSLCRSHSSASSTTIGRSKSSSSSSSPSTISASLRNLWTTSSFLFLILSSTSLIIPFASASASPSPSPIPSPFPQGERGGRRFQCLQLDPLDPSASIEGSICEKFITWNHVVSWEGSIQIQKERLDKILQNDYGIAAGQQADALDACLAVAIANECARGFAMCDPPPQQQQQPQNPFKYVFFPCAQNCDTVSTKCSGGESNPFVAKCRDHSERGRPGGWGGGNGDADRCLSMGVDASGAVSFKRVEEGSGATSSAGVPTGTMTLTSTGGASATATTTTTGTTSTSKPVASSVPDTGNSTNLDEFWKSLCPPPLEVNPDKDVLSKILSGQMVIGKPTDGNSTDANMNPKGCSGPCCLPCPMYENLSPPTKLRNIISYDLIPIMTISALSALFVAISHLVLPSRRNAHGYFVASINAGVWIMVGLATMMGVPDHRSVICKNRMTIIPLALDKVNGKTGFVCVIDYASAFELFFAPQAVFVLSALIMFLISLIYVTILAFRKPPTSPAISRDDLPASPGSTMSGITLVEGRWWEHGVGGAGEERRHWVKKQVKVHWRAGVLVGVFLVCWYGLFYITSQYKKYSADVGANEAWYMEWYACLKQNAPDGQAACASIADQNLPDTRILYPLMNLTLLQGLFFLIIFMSKRGLYSEWVEVLFPNRKVKEAAFVIGGGVGSARVARRRNVREDGMEMRKRSRSGSRSAGSGSTEKVEEERGVEGRRSGEKRSRSRSRSRERQGWRTLEDGGDGDVPPVPRVPPSVASLKSRSHPNLGGVGEGEGEEKKRGVVRMSSSVSDPGRARFRKYRGDGDEGLLGAVWEEEGRGGEEGIVVEGQEEEEEEEEVEEVVIVG